MRWFTLFLIGACTPTEPNDLVVPSAPTVATEPVATGDAEDFTITVQDGSEFRLWDHAGDVILIDMSGFT